MMYLDPKESLTKRRIEKLAIENWYLFRTIPVQHSGDTCSLFDGNHCSNLDCSGQPSSQKTLQIPTKTISRYFIKP